jgi:short subunit dehydrogenase-like uncharacterized protein
MDSPAKAAGIMLLPGAGFDVVPSDCLAAHLKKRLPTATHFRLFLRGVGAGVSRGTAKSAVENMHRQGLIRGGQLVRCRRRGTSASAISGASHTKVVSVGWATSARHITQAFNIETYLPFLKE